MGADDRLLVYFAGHGVALDGDDGPRGYLVPQDARPGDSASMLAMTDLNAWLIALPCRHMLAILDCCFAGAFRWSSTRDLGALPEVIHKERYDRYLLSPAWEVLTSAAYDQTALDVLAGDAKRGARLGEDGPHSPLPWPCSARWPRRGRGAQRAGRRRHHRQRAVRLPARRGVARPRSRPTTSRCRACGR
ncbi:MAG: caspase family protein [Anaerolineae bacterium]|nr:MAG: caspase family protein [Anaerolineae bacterium]